MRKALTISAAAAAVALSTVTAAVAQGQSVSGNAANSLGKTTVDTTVAAVSSDEMDYGDGIRNGEWVTAENQGVVLGLRATDRTDGLLDVSGTNGNRVGVYEASTGFDTGTANRAEWNYEWSVDLSQATGNAEGRTVEDYRLTLEQDYTQQNLFGALGTDPVQLPMPGTCDPDAATSTLCQQSWNPTFGNTDFDATVAATYTLRLVLQPETFNGAPLAVKIHVNVS